MQPFRVLLIGATGQFGRRIAAELAGDVVIQLIVAGRDAAALATLADALTAAHPDGGVQTATVDVSAADLPVRLQALAPQLVIHTAGPFQGQDYHVAEAALRAGAHYVDLADGRQFVAGIGAIDALATSCGRWAIAGASSVPGLSAAVIAALLPRFSRLDAVESAISPGNRTERGLATTRAILGYVGKPYPALIDGQWQPVIGWQSLRRMQIPGCGTRWFARCEVPDLAILPQRHPSLRHCDFRAGLELRRMHLGLWAASWLVRGKLLPSMQPWAAPLLRLSNRWLRAGSDTGVMLIDLRGLDAAGRPLTLRWRIVADAGSGPQIPATPAVVLARKLARRQLPGAGAVPCLDLFTLDDCLDALRPFPIHTHVDVQPA